MVCTLIMSIFTRLAPYDTYPSGLCSGLGFRLSPNASRRFPRSLLISGRRLLADEFTRRERRHKDQVAPRRRQWTNSCQRVTQCACDRDLAETV